MKENICKERGYHEWDDIDYYECYEYIAVYSTCRLCGAKFCTDEAQIELNEEEE